MLIDFSHWGQTLKMMSRAAPRLLETQLDVGQGLVHFVSQTWLREKPWGIHGAFWLFGDAKYPRLCCVNKVKENLENRVSMKCVSLGDTSMNIFHYSARWAKTRLPSWNMFCSSWNLWFRVKHKYGWKSSWFSTVKLRKHPLFINLTRRRMLIFWNFRELVKYKQENVGPKDRRFQFKIGPIFWNSFWFFVSLPSQCWYLNRYL